MKYLPTIGLEIHAELKTNSKMFCSCKNDPDETKPNTNICPICLGHPGTLPVLNHEAIRKVLLVGLAVGNVSNTNSASGSESLLEPQSVPTELDEGGTFPSSLRRGGLSESSSENRGGDIDATTPSFTRGLVQDTPPQRGGVETHTNLADFTEWDRKNYFYPDIPKGYQISQYKFPLVSSGSLSGVELERIHLEEDTASSIHFPTSNLQPLTSTNEIPTGVYPVLRHGVGMTSKLSGQAFSLIDFNRSGVPLMELVTKPVIHDAETAVGFAKELQLLLKYLDISGANLEKGEMRIEANISVAPLHENSDKNNPDGQVILGTKTEVKNLNSFRAVERAIQYEIKRQTELLEKGQKVLQETRGWDEAKGATYSQRKKESSHDYRYFPDPDIPKMKLSEIPEFSPEFLAKSLKELPSQKRARYKNSYKMTDKEIAVFVEDPELAIYFESIIEPFKEDAKKVKLTTNYILTDYLGAIKNTEVSPRYSIKPLYFGELVNMLSANEISSRGAKDLIPIMLKNTEVSPRKLAADYDLLQKSDSSAIEPAIKEVIAKNEKAVQEYKAGKIASLQFLIGQAMKATKGAANPAIVKELLQKELAN